MSEFYNNKLKNLNKYNLNKYVSAVQYSEWTTYGGVLEMPAKGATACDLLQRQRGRRMWIALSIRMLLPLIIIDGYAFNPLKVTMFLNQYCLRVWRRRVIITII